MLKVAPLFIHTHFLNLIIRNRMKDATEKDVQLIYKSFKHNYIDQMSFYVLFS